MCEDNKEEDNRERVNVGSSLPVLGGISYTCDELDSFGVVVDLCVQAQVFLHKVPRGHQLLAICIYNTGMLGVGGVTTETASLWVSC